MPHDDIFTVRGWKKELDGKISDKESGHIMLLLATYHISPKESVKIRILHKIESYCITCIHECTGTKWNKSQHLVIPMLKLLNAVDRKKKTFENLNLLYNALDVKHAGGGKTLDQGYWLERADPQHRAWTQSDDGKYLYKSWFQNENVLTFWDWLKKYNYGTALPKVEYLNAKDLWKYQIWLYRRRLYYWKNFQYALFNTKNLKTVHNGNGFAIFVTSLDDVFYTGSHELSKFHHSSFLSGNRVKCAGEWVVNDGEILLITHKTGHYRASIRDLYVALKILNSSVDLKNTIVEIMSKNIGYDAYIYGNSNKIYLMANEFLFNQGNIRQCKNFLQIGIVKSRLGGVINSNWYPR